MRILHLGFEDHRRPGSGGGSGRNHEVNRRLAQNHDVTVVVAAYPGCMDRVEEGVRYRHVGVGGSYTPSVLSYFACLPWVVKNASRKRLCDLIVEEFAPPFASLGIAAWSSLPTCANVQWFFTAEKAREYRLPSWTLETVERWGVRRHAHIVAVSNDLADQIRTINRRANIEVIGSGVAPPDLGAPISPIPRSSIFLGRLDIEHKGLDLLLKALAVLPSGATDLTIAGEGRGRREIEEQVRRLNLGDRVRLVGDVRGEDKWRLLAEAQLVVMPSRRETFGLSALEAMAMGRPVLAFDIPCLRNVVTSERGELVEPFRIEAFANAWDRLLNDPDKCERLGQAGLKFARSQTWDDMAQRQGAFYERCV
jgi:glycogen synthase